MSLKIICEIAFRDFGERSGVEADLRCKLLLTLRKKTCF